VKKVKKLVWLWVELKKKNSEKSEKIGLAMG
jgi:hypothetical protein